MRLSLHIFAGTRGQKKHELASATTVFDSCRQDRVQESNTSAMVSLVGRVAGVISVAQRMMVFFVTHAIDIV